MTTRREFLKNSALVTAASAAGAAGAPRFAFGQAAGGKTLIKVFMRGGADGLHLMPCFGDILYYQYRPKIAIEPPNGSDSNSAIDLGDSRRGLNPNLEPLMEIWGDGRLTLSPCTALDEGNRSHFDCQRWIGTGAKNDFIDGYLNRYLQSGTSNSDALAGLVAGKTSISTEIRGDIIVPAISSGESFELESPRFCQGSGCADNQLTELIRSIASHEVDQPGVEGNIKDNQLILVDSLDRVKSASDGYVTNAGGLEYSNSSLGRGLKLVAQLLKAGIPLEVAALDWNIGWDTHKNQTASGSAHVSSQAFTYHLKMREGATDFVTFYRDIASVIDDVVVVCGSEFGRTVLENGSRGTDHGHGGVWFSFGGPSTSQIAQDVNTLDIEDLGFGNKLPTVVNYRDMVGELMVRHLGMPQNLVSTVFPGHAFNDIGLYTQSS